MQRLPINIKLSLLLITCSILGCGKDLCDKVSCSPNSYCYNGNCTCVDGYMGKACDSTWVGIYSGVYIGTTTTSHGNVFTDTVEIHSSTFPYSGTLTYKVEKQSFDILIYSSFGWWADPDYQSDTIYASVGPTFRGIPLETGMEGSCVRVRNQQIVESWYFVGWKTH